MAHRVDTSVLARLANTGDPFHAFAVQADLRLQRSGEVLNITPQNLVEFRDMATRPSVVNGLGLSAVDAEAQAGIFEASFPLLVETPDIYPAWKAVVVSLGITGKQLHDARLVAVCHIHGVTHLLTFNVSHFTRMSKSGRVSSWSIRPAYARAKLGQR